MTRQSLAFQYVPKACRGPEDEIKILVLDDDQFDRMRIRRLIHQIDATVHVEEIDGSRRCVQVWMRMNSTWSLSIIVCPRVTVWRR